VTCREGWVGVKWGEVGVEGGGGVGCGWGSAGRPKYTWGEPHPSWVMVAQGWAHVQAMEGPMCLTVKFV
jgi:hypothetical protein